MKRQPSVAGQFYSGSENLLRKEVQHLLGTNKAKSKQKAIGVIVPHAGYIYSGAVAGCVFSSIEIPDTVIILGPNHTGLGLPFSIFKEGSWHMPLGDVDIASELADAILKKSKTLKEDIKAHAHEHSLEVQLPFLQCLKKNFRIVPIVLSVCNYQAYEDIGQAIASAVEEFKKDVLIIASSDMTHYEEYETAQEKDKVAIDTILKLDEKLLIQKVEQMNITMCGYIPASVMLIAAKKLGATSATLVKYQTSSETTGDYNSVVGYAGLIIK